MFVRCAKGRVYEVLLENQVRVGLIGTRISTIEYILYEVKDRDPIAYRREQAGAIGGKEQVTLTVDRPQKIGELQQDQ